MSDIRETKRCPYCGEEILAVAKKCKYCGEWLDEEENQENGNSDGNRNTNYENNHKGENSIIKPIILSSIGIIVLMLLNYFLFNESSMSSLTSGCKNNGTNIRNAITRGEYETREEYYCKNKYYDKIYKTKGLTEKYYNYEVIKLFNNEVLDSGLFLDNVGERYWSRGDYFCRLAIRADAFNCSESEFIRYYKKSVDYTRDMFDYMSEYLQNHPEELNYIKKRRWDRNSMPLFEYRENNLTKEDLDNYSGKKSFDEIIKTYPVTNYKSSISKVSEIADDYYENEYDTIKEPDTKQFKNNDMESISQSETKSQTINQVPQNNNPMKKPVTEKMTISPKNTGQIYSSPQFSSSIRNQVLEHVRTSGYSNGLEIPKSQNKISEETGNSKQVDFGPYMKNLQTRIKANWHPPQCKETMRIMVLFSVAKNGQLIKANIIKSSGNQEADNAALEAVKLTAPFKPLPSEYQKNYVDIQFTFDKKVFGLSGY